MRLIDANALLKTLGMAEECDKCPNKKGIFCALSSEMVDVCEAIEDAPTVLPFETKSPEVQQPDLASIVGTEALEKILAQAAKVGEAVGELISQFLEALNDRD